MNTKKDATKKEILLDAITNDYLSKDVIELIYDIANISEFPNKRDLLKFAGYDVNKTFDTAYPIDYFRRIEEIYPDVKKGNYIFDYSQNNYGELVNINNLIVERILKTLMR